MLYDERRVTMLTESDEYKRKVQDLLYDVESYMIDLVYGENRIIKDDKTKTETKEKSKNSDTQLKNSERESVIKSTSDMLVLLGVPQRIKGFKIIVECVVMAVTENVNNRPYYLLKMYPNIAEKFNVTENNAEKLSRYACRYIDVNNPIVTKLQIFRNFNSRNYKDISLKELIDVLVEYALENSNLKTVSRRDAKRWQ